MFQCFQSIVSKHVDGGGEEVGKMEDSNGGGAVCGKLGVVASAVQATPGIRKATLTD